MRQVLGTSGTCHTRGASIASCTIEDDRTGLTSMSIRTSNPAKRAAHPGGLCLVRRFAPHRFGTHLWQLPTPLRDLSSFHFTFGTALAGEIVLR